MPTIKFKANKMSSANVSHISLVERGANRIPFKIVKQEKQGMSKFAGIDLGNLFARKSEVKATEVVGVVVMKGEHYESIKKQIKEAGYDVDQAIESDDGSVIFKQGENVEGEGIVIRMNDDVAIVTKGFAPYNMDVSQGDQSFSDMCQARGFYPGVSTIMETLAESVRDAVYKADTPEKAKVNITKLFSEAQAYTAAFVAGLPQKAFKLESVAPEYPNGDGVTTEETDKTTDDESVEKSAKKPMEGESEGSAGGKEETDEDKAKAKAACKSEGTEDDAGASDEASGDEESTVSSLTEDQVSSIVSTQVTKAMDALAEKLGAFTAGVEAIQKSVGDLGGGLKELQGRMDEAEKVAKSAKDAVSGTVVIGSETGDHNPTKKSESSGFGGRAIDTAYNPGVRSRGRASR